MLSRIGLSIALLLGTVTMCKADTVGPLTLGNTSPFGADGATAPFSLGNGVYLSLWSAPGIDISGMHGRTYFNYTVSFSYNLAPGWMIDNVSLFNNLDFGTPKNPHVPWGYSLSEEMVLCPVTGSCTTGTMSSHAGNLNLPPVFLSSHTAAGTGTYEVAGWVEDTQIATNGDIQNMNVSMSPVPEPSSIVLLAVGIAGLPAIEVLRRRR